MFPRLADIDFSLYPQCLLMEKHKLSISGNKVNLCWINLKLPISNISCVDAQKIINFALLILCANNFNIDFELE